MLIKICFVPKFNVKVLVLYQSITIFDDATVSQTKQMLWATLYASKVILSDQVTFQNKT